MIILDIAQENIGETVSNDISLSDIVYCPSIDIYAGLRRAHIDPSYDFVERIRSATSINDLRSLGLNDQALNLIIEGQTRSIEQTYINNLLRRQIQAMADFALNNGAETSGGIGVESGFNHVHLLLSTEIPPSPDKITTWNLVQQNILYLLGHTQELRIFDKTRRSILCDLRQQSISILNTSNPDGTVYPNEIAPLDHTRLYDAGTLYFSMDQTRNMTFKVSMNAG